MTSSGKIIRKWSFVKPAKSSGVIALEALLLAIAAHAVFALLIGVNTQPAASAPSGRARITLLSGNAVSSDAYADLTGWLNLHRPDQLADWSGENGLYRQLPPSPLREVETVPMRRLPELTAENPIGFSPLPSGKKTVGSQPPLPTEKAADQSAEALPEVKVLDASGNTVVLPVEQPPGGNPTGPTIVALRRVGMLPRASVLKSSGCLACDRAAGAAILRSFERFPEEAVLVVVWTLPAAEVRI